MPESRNMTLLAQNDLAGHGAVGEGMSMQTAKDGRRILWLAHWGPPKNFTGVDVTDPRNPRVVVQRDLAHKDMRSNSLEVTGDVMAVAYQTSGPGGVGDPGLGMQPAGIELFDVSTPETPKRISFFDCSGPHSMGVHQLWFCDGEYIHCAAGAADFKPRNRRDSQFYRCIDVRDPSKPEEVGRWWYPGTRDGDRAEAPPRHPRYDSGYRAHNTNVYPDRPDRAYVAYIDGGIVILDISDKSQPKAVGWWNPHPPYPGFSHTVMPLLDRDLLVVTDETIVDAAVDWPKLSWVIDARQEDNLVPVATLPMPPFEAYADRGGRFGSHNLHENRPGPAFRSNRYVFGAYFNAGVRAFDLENPYQPKEVAFFVPDPPRGSKAGASQINDVYVDENQIVYAVDCLAGGLYVLEVDL